MWRHRFQDEFQWKSPVSSFPQHTSRTDNTLLRQEVLKNFQNPTIFLKISCDGDYVLPIVVGMYVCYDMFQWCKCLCSIIFVLLTLILCWCRKDCYWKAYRCWRWTRKWGNFFDLYHNVCGLDIYIFFVTDTYETVVILQDFPDQFQFVKNLVERLDHEVWS